MLRLDSCAHVLVDTSSCFQTMRETSAALNLQYVRCCLLPAASTRAAAGCSALPCPALRGTDLGLAAIQSGRCWAKAKAEHFKRGYAQLRGQAGERGGNGSTTALQTSTQLEAKLGTSVLSTEILLKQMSFFLAISGRFAFVRPKRPVQISCASSCKICHSKMGYCPTRRKRPAYRKISCNRLQAVHQLLTATEPQTAHD